MCAEQSSILRKGCSPVGLQEQQLEELTRLIVAHCTETVRDVLREEGSDLSYETADKLQQRMKEFFGITY